MADNQEFGSFGTGTVKPEDNAAGLASFAGLSGPQPKKDKDEMNAPEVAGRALLSGAPRLAKEFVGTPLRMAGQGTTSYAKEQEKGFKKLRAKSREATGKPLRPGWDYEDGKSGPVDVGKMLESAGTKINEVSDEASKYWSESVPERYRKSFVSYNPQTQKADFDFSVMKDSNWWIYNSVNFLPELATTLMTGVASGKLATRLGAGDRLAKLSATLAGSAVGGWMEGSNTYEEMVANGSSPEDARRASILMSLGSGVLNKVALDRWFTKLPPTVRGKLMAQGWRATVEGITEYLEEPTEMAAKAMSGEVPSFQDLQAQLINGLNVIPATIAMSLFVPGGNFQSNITPTKTDQTTQTFDTTAPKTPLKVPKSQGAHLTHITAEGERISLKPGEQVKPVNEKDFSTIKPLQGMPTSKINLPSGNTVVPGPSSRVEGVARKYMASSGITKDPIKDYRTADKKRGASIAKAYDEMKHDPRNSEVKRSYDAMISETNKQYEAMLESGLTVEFMPKGHDPYEGNPRAALEDINKNNHLYIYPTDEGFGQEGQGLDHPLLVPTEFQISGKTATANDIFRAVHDYFGHARHGNGFRASGEENAWRSHSRMYSDEALGAMTTETRGQNSWVNFGPHGDKNRTAKQGETVYAEQKAGILPKWVLQEEGDPNILRFPGKKVQLDKSIESGRPLRILTSLKMYAPEVDPESTEARQPFRLIDTDGGAFLLYGKDDVTGWQFWPKRPIKGGSSGKDAPVFYSQMEKFVSEKFPNRLPAHEAARVLDAWAKQGKFKQEEYELPGGKMKQTLYQMLSGSGAEAFIDKEDLLEAIQRRAPKIEEVVYGNLDNEKIERLRKSRRTLEVMSQNLATDAEVEKYRQVRKKMSELGGDADRIDLDTLMVEVSEGSSPLVDSSKDKIQKIIDKYGSLGLDIKPFVDYLSRRYSADAEANKISLELGKELQKGTKHDHWTLGGGKNYKEVLFKLPVKDTEQSFAHPHWSEQNVMAHVRFDERTDAEGKKTLFIQEVQSDWHQQGRDQGYSGSTNITQNISDAETKRTEAERALIVAGQKLKDLGLEWGGSTTVFAVHGTGQPGTLTTHGDRYVPTTPVEIRPGEWVVGLPDGTLEDRHEGFYTNHGGATYSSPEAAWNESYKGAHNNRPMSAEQYEAWKGLRRAYHDFDAANMDVIRAGAGRSGAVPDAPFKKTWPMLVMKRMMRYAAENGFDRIAWTTGEMQADRYDLSHRVKSVFWYPEDGRLEVVTHGNRGAQEIEKGVDKEKLPDYIGKSATEKLLKSKQRGGAHFLAGVDLKIGGEGMKAFYDRILPNEVNKYVKKFLTKVGSTKIPVTEEKVESHSNLTVDEESIADVHSIDVTPAMRKAVLSEGQPMFRDGGLV